ncbi:MAG: hypothetical protein PVH54_04300 [Gammaproteobacteria bacterium]|jgi:hypothetical protein
MRYLVYLLVLANVAYLGWNVHLNQTAGEIALKLPALPAGITPLVTLHELETQQQHTESVSGVETLTASQPPGAGAAPTCQSIGPFLAMEDLHPVSEKLQLHGVQARQRTSEIQKPNGYWVYLPAMKREQVLRAVKTLEENKDHEYYVGKGNFLSLGIFDERPRAETRLKQARKLGFDPILEARYQASTEYWLDIDAHKPATDELGAIMQDRPGLKLQEIACP